MKLSAKSEYALAAYIIFFLAINITGSSFFTDIGWAPYIESTSNTAPPSGSAWVENKGIRWADGSNEYYTDYQQLQLEVHLDEGSGSTATGFSDYSRDGSVNGATWTSGRYGQALSFDGSDDYVQIDGWNGITGKTGRTWNLWFKSSSSQDQRMISYGFNNNGEKYDIRVDSGNGDVLRVENSGGQKYGSTNIVDGQWHMLTVVCSNPCEDVQDHRLYVDGSLETNTGGGSQSLNTASSNNVWIGQSHFHGDTVNGKIDEVKAYSRAISQEKIRNLYNGAGSRSGGTAGDAWVEGNSLHWIDQNNVERSITGAGTGDSPGNSGNAWIEDSVIHYIDENGEERVVAVPWRDHFEDGNADGWTGSNYYVKSDYARGTYSIGTDGQGSIDAEITPDGWEGGLRPDTLSYQWWEEQSQTGFTVDFIDSNGDYVLRSGGNNPQWEVSDGSGSTTVYTGSNYRDWTEYTFDFDWDNCQYSYDFHNHDTGYTNTGTRNLDSCSGIETIRLSNDNGNWGNAEYMRFDAFVATSP